MFHTPTNVADPALSLLLPVCVWVCSMCSCLARLTRHIANKYSCDKLRITQFCPFDASRVCYPPHVTQSAAPVGCTAEARIPRAGQLRIHIVVVTLFSSP